MVFGLEKLRGNNFGIIVLYMRSRVIVEERMLNIFDVICLFGEKKR